MGEIRRPSVYEVGINYDTAATIRGDSPLNFRLSSCFSSNSSYQTRLLYDTFSKKSIAIKIFLKIRTVTAIFGHCNDEKKKEA